MDTRYAPLEYRSAPDGPGRLDGVLLRYGDVAKFGLTHERVMPGAFGNVAELDVIANVLHDHDRPLARSGPGGNLTLADSATELRATIVLPDTRDGTEVAELARYGVLRGYSVEMRVDEEDQQGVMRTIRAARLDGLGVVDLPAYRQSEVDYAIRRAGGLRGQFRYGATRVTGNSGRKRKQRIDRGAFEYAIREPDREIILSFGNRNHPLARKGNGSLKLKDTPQGVEFSVARLPATSDGRNVDALLGEGLITGVFPRFITAGVADAIELVPEAPGSDILVEVVKNAVLTDLILTVADEFPGGELARIPARRRRMLWR